MKVFSLLADGGDDGWRWWRRQRGVAACREIASTAVRRQADYTTAGSQALQALVGIRARADSLQLVRTARGGVSGVWRSLVGPTSDACLLARSLACLLAGLLRVCGPGGCRERWSNVQQVPAAVWRDEGQRKAETRRAECRVQCRRQQVRDLAGYAGLSPISRAGCGTVARRGEGKRMEKRWERAWAAKDLLRPRETTRRMKRVKGFSISRWVSVFVRRKR
jgi:hypothetical protein